MRLLKTACLLTCTLLYLTAAAQKQSFDVVSFSIPKGWQQKQNEGSVQLLATEKKSGAYIMAIITRASPSATSAIENFNSKWKDAIKDQLHLEGDPTMQPSSNSNGWDVEAGNANFMDNGVNSSVALLSATGGGQTVSVVIMTNSKQYESDLMAFLNSLELAAPSATNNGQSPAPATNPGMGASPIKGLWTSYVLETTGYSINGRPQYTAGYLRKEYAFYADGTYLFRNKQWLTKVNNIVYVYETGTYSVDGNELTLTPTSGKGGFWKKKASSKEWGSLVKWTDSKLEKTTYRFAISIDPSYGNALVLTAANATARDGGQFNAPGDPFEFRYSFRALESSIDNPPSLKTGFENKSLSAVEPIQTNTPVATTTFSPITGKTWQGSSSEKMGAGNLQTNTGGFFTNQYKFYPDGTYRFVQVNASHYTSTKSLNYETGTYSISGNQLSIVPTKGSDEEWTKIGKTSNGNSDVSNRAINETWNKKQQTAPRKLERTTYTFRIEYQEGNHANALILEGYNGHTEREGNGTISYYFETPEPKSVRLPPGFEDKPTI